MLGKIITIGLVVVLITDFKNVLSMHWHWLDSHHVIGSQLWHPQSDLVRIGASMGRDWTGFELFYHLLTLIIPINNDTGMIWQYIVNYGFHFSSIAMSGIIVKTVTFNYTFTFGTMLAIALASSGPEVFLTLVKNEVQGTFWILCACQLFIMDIARVVTQRYRRILIRVVMVLCGFLATGFLGKEPLVLFWVALIGTLIMLHLMGFHLSGIDERGVLHSVSYGGAGVVLYWIYRVVIGVANPLAGSYSSKFLQVPSLERTIHHLGVYIIYSQDIIIFTAMAALLILFAIVRGATGALEILLKDFIAMSLGVFSILYCIFYITMSGSVQFYYLYPVSFGAIIGGFILLTPRGQSTGLGGRFTHMVVLAAIAYAVMFGATRWFSRSASVVLVTSAVHTLVQNIAKLPHNSVVLLPFAKTDERLASLPVLLRVIHGRPDLQFIGLSEINEFKNNKNSFNCNNIKVVSLIKAPSNFLVGTRDLTSWENSGLTGEIEKEVSPTISPRAESIGSRRTWVARFIVIPPLVDVRRNDIAWQADVELGWLLSQFHSNDYC